jgi:hypothetical protein
MSIARRPNHGTCFEQEMTERTEQSEIYLRLAPLEGGFTLISCRSVIVSCSPWP